jgi:hypothetical protein
MVDSRTKMPGAKLKKRKFLDYFVSLLFWRVVRNIFVLNQVNYMLRDPTQVN